MAPASGPASATSPSRPRRPPSSWPTRWGSSLPQGPKRPYPRNCFRAIRPRGRKGCVAGNAAPRDFQGFLASLAPDVGGLPGYVAETVRCGPRFYRDIAAGMNSLPAAYHRELHAAGVRVLLGDRLVNMEPALL